MVAAYPRWLKGKWTNRHGQLITFGSDIRIGNFEKFSHYWARQQPLAPESMDLFAAVQRESPAGYAAVDVGANVGITCLALANAGFTKVIALEPTLGTFDRLQKNLFLNPRLKPRIVAWPAAAGAKSGRFPFHIQHGSSEQNGFVAKSNKDDLANQIQVDVVTIDQLLTANGLLGVGLLKIDVEGFEFEVLLGARQSFERNIIRYVYLELIEEALAGAGTSMADIENLLAGYNLYPQIWAESVGFKRASLSEALVRSGNDRSVLFGPNPPTEQICIS